MKIDEAIEILNHKISQNVFQVDPDALVALKLGKEALKYVLKDRKGTFTILLPGETEE